MKTRVCGRRKETGTRQLESAYWPPAHCEALTEFVTGGMSYRAAADAINARFGTSYSRNAALGRGRRMGLGEPDRFKPLPMAEAASQQALRRRSDDSVLLELLRRRPVFQRRNGVRLRCVDVDPRRLTLADLEGGDCRYPYGGEVEGEAVTFCGHRRRKGSSYCTPHFHLTRKPEVPAERTASVASLRLVAAAGNYRVEKLSNGRQKTQETL